MRWPPFVRVAVLVVVCSGLFGLFVLDGARWGPVHTSAVEPVWGAADPTDLTWGPIAVSVIEQGPLRGDPSGPAPSDEWYVWSVSVLGGCWIALRAVLGWRFDSRSLAFEPRDRPRGVLEALRDLFKRGRSARTRRGRER